MTNKGLVSMIDGVLFDKLVGFYILFFFSRDIDAL